MAFDVWFGARSNSRKMVRLHYIIVFVFLASSCIEHAPTDLPPRDPLVVVTKSGEVRGKVVGSTRAFMGIPYAAPPKRFAPPEPPAPWSGVREATEPGKRCSQRSFAGDSFDTSTSEDCLFLNVWTPMPPASGALPVLVWIHGGAYESGSGSHPSFDGDKLVPTANVVLVTFNYRLGPFGFLAHPALDAELGADGKHPPSGNFGIQDQQRALEWIAENIVAFGGDPNRVTLAGESAGGYSVCAHMVAPKSANLFHRAIIQSGPCQFNLKRSEALEQGKALVDKLGCVGPGDAALLSCLRDKSALETFEALPRTVGYFFAPNATTKPARWRPNIDGALLAKAPLDAFADGSALKIPVLLGSNRDEGTIFVAAAGKTGIDAKEYEEIVAAHADVLGRSKDDLLKIYPAASYKTSADALETMVGQAMFNCPARRMIRSLATKAKVDAFGYHFVYPFQAAGLKDLGAFHGAEVAFLFDTTFLGLSAALTSDERRMSQTIMGYWGRFAATGNPNTTAGTAVLWPKYVEKDDVYLTLDVDNVGPGQPYTHNANCDKLEAPPMMMK